MRILRWRCLDATHHELVDQDGEIWGDIYPAQVLGQLQATCRQPEFRERGRREWSGTASTVAGAKTILQAFLDVRAARAAEAFDFA